MLTINIKMEREVDIKNIMLISDNGFLIFTPNQFLSAFSQLVPLSDCGIDNHLHVIRVVLCSIGYLPEMFIRILLFVGYEVIGFRKALC